MRKPEHRSGADNPGGHNATGKRFKYELNEATINQFLADGDSCDQREEYQAFEVVLGEYLQRKLWQDALNFRGPGDQAPQTRDLIGKNQRRKCNRYLIGEAWLRNGEPEASRRDPVRSGAP